MMMRPRPHVAQGAQVRKPRPCVSGVSRTRRVGPPLAAAPDPKSAVSELDPPPPSAPAPAPAPLAAAPSLERLLPEAMQSAAPPAQEQEQISILDEREASMRSSRPLVPPLDLPFLAEALFGKAEARPELQQLFKLEEQGGAPRLYTPGVTRPPGSPPSSSLPLLLYLPGIDGTGLAAYRQFPTLSSRFDLRALFIPPSDRSSFSELSASVTALLKAELQHAAPSRPVYLLGESFGGLLALNLALLLPGAIDRIVLVNPATAFSDSPWPRLGPALVALPQQLYNALPIALSPLLANPIAMAMHGVNPDAPFPRQVSDAAYALLDLIPELSALRQALPPDTLAWRLNLLQEGAKYCSTILNKVPQRVLLLVGQLDLVIPSNTEGPRLQRTMQRCRLKVLPLRSHAMLQEAGVNLVDILDEEGFYQPTRNLTSTPTAPAAAAAAAAKRRPAPPPPPPPPPGPPGPSAQPTAQHSSESGNGNGNGNGAAAAASAAPVGEGEGEGGASAATSASSAAVAPAAAAAASWTAGGGANFGVAAPLELPTLKELEAAMEAGNLSNLRRLVSPVFFSTEASTGRIVRGLDGIPDCRPLLFVGNHQLFAPDMPLMIAEFLKERQMLLRGLAHPMALEGMTSSSNDGTASDSGPEFSPFGSFLKTFGAVPVSGTNLYKLLSLNEAALLYPGGAREANKRRGEKYQLLWPRRQEFVRMACRFGATIIPFAAIGAEDGVEIVRDGEELLQTPVLGDLLRNQLADRRPPPLARKGVNAIAEEERELMSESMMMPLMTPNLPARFYYVFRRPITTDPSLVRDKAATDALYTQIKAEVQGGLSYLLDKRQEDEYADFGRRVLYEVSRGGRVQAPTFEP